MSKMAELALDIEELLAEGMSPKFIAVTLNCPIEMVYDNLEQLENLELEKKIDIKNERENSDSETNNKSD